MKKILVLGAGFVSKPGAVYLLKQGYGVTVASRTLPKAQKIVLGFENGSSLQFEIQDEEHLDALAARNDIVVSLLP
jgi:saccharopine dehydrogenase-like NADP-dependent oxidoreductase